MSDTHAPRIDHFAIAGDLFRPMMDQETLLKDSGLEHSLIELVKLRASQINGCAFCINMHWQDAKAHGERDERLYLLNAWSEASVYSPRERAALAWTEALTRIETSQAPDADYAQIAAHFAPREQVALSLLISAINTWNRIAIGFRMPHALPEGAAAA
ncbi:alkylhydroperoxidase AhpD family core domain protein [Tritonibacter multivorans]|uniref:Alkylhydroperoxidase AhpD family core domain protein n=1 Tax=Tritonibacter multivorans TaxID=928856 RepID=A0A0P1G460_9RHOB|nr:carboxymuconolactone decarboxylase family protein [Tritonibacter multivorans]MDA7422610.1 carboxymuconolactone decarboxylase family protein [Tritonibacter multivorans]CUH76471.1 alkylhydroperoxidase AhpD family core domain protein [Tritonibacter multivorans]SFD37412.1 alkylhydroperoxidase AhpD family core domain-containing protein [Tritonibacter multivorans]